MEYNLLEEWANIDGYDNRYQISNFGNVRSNFSGSYKILQPRVRQHGYLCIALYDKGKQNNISIHRLVAEYFWDKIENKNEVNHKNGNKTDNCFLNLEWVDRKENMRHSAENNLSLRGEKSPSAKLKESDIIDIRNLVFEMTISEISKKYDVAFKTIKKILVGQTWKHISYDNKKEVLFCLENSEMHKKRGEYCSKSKLTLEMVRRIKNIPEEDSFTTHKQIAEKFGISKSAVQSILCGKTWGWVC